jgi:broad specificity phosphatase PhoE
VSAHRRCLLLFLLLASVPANVARAAAKLPPLAPGSTRFILVRHGEAWSNVAPARVPTGLTDEDALTQVGEAQARKVGEALRAARVTLVLVSPKHRTHQTASIVEGLIGRTPQDEDARLDSLRSGKHPDGTHVGWDERERAWRKGKDAPGVGGESMRDVLARADAALRDAAARHPGATILVVTHTEVISPLIGELRGVSPEKAAARSVRHGSLTVVDVDAGGKRTLRLVDKAP